MRKVFTFSLLFLFAVAWSGIALGQETTQSAPAKEATQSSDQQITLTAKEVKAVQQALFSRGYLLKNPSGVLDAETRQALRDFQTAQKLDVTGRVDSATLEKLEITLPLDPAPGDSTRKGGVASKIGYGIKDTATSTGKSISSTAGKIGSGTKSGTEKAISSTSDAVTKSGDAITTTTDKSVEGAKGAGTKVSTTVVGRSDVDIHKDVRKLLNSNEATRYLQSEVKEGKVTLTSQAGAEHDLGSVVSDVRKIAGVKSVIVVQR